jgi:dihydrofolate reductase
VTESAVNASGVTGQNRIPIILVVAVAENGVIGRDNQLPWRIKSDLKYFRAITMNKPVVMGRKTYASIGRPLPGRTNIIVSRRDDFTATGVLVAPGIDQALAAARGDALRRGTNEIAIIGGTEIFNQVMPMADRLALTQVHAKPEGDTYFPPIDPAVWREIDRTPQSQGPDDEYGFTIINYGRRDHQGSGAS